MLLQLVPLELETVQLRVPAKKKKVLERREEGVKRLVKVLKTGIFTVDFAFIVHATHDPLRDFNLKLRVVSGGLETAPRPYHQLC